MIFFLKIPVFVSADLSVSSHYGITELHLEHFVKCVFDVVLCQL